MAADCSRWQRREHRHDVHWAVSGAPSIIREQEPMVTTAAVMALVMAVRVAAVVAVAAAAAAVTELREPSVDLTR
jgi:hypothetical protein